jgi:hypothetical protein
MAGAMNNLNLSALLLRARIAAVRLGVPLAWRSRCAPPACIWRGCCRSAPRKRS